MQLVKQTGGLLPSAAFWTQNNTVCFYNSAIIYCKWVLFVCSVVFWQESRQLGERGRAKRNVTEGQRSYDNHKGRLSQQFLSARVHLYGKGISPKFHAQNCNFLQELVFSFRNPTTVKLCKLIASIQKKKKVTLISNTCNWYPPKIKAILLKRLFHLELENTNIWKCF